jgi:ribonucleotide reductase alpha subunit
MRLADNALRVLEARCPWRDPSGPIMETPQGLFHRVAHAVAEAENCFERFARCDPHACKL